MEQYVATGRVDTTRTRALVSIARCNLDTMHCNAHNHGVEREREREYGHTAIGIKHINDRYRKAEHRVIGEA
jgi:hypothetical protein